jgi:CRISPR-associated endonuclease Cas1
VRTQRFCSRTCQTQWFVPFVSKDSPVRRAKAAKQIGSPDNEYLKLIEGDDDAIWALRAKYWDAQTDRSPQPKIDSDNDIAPAQPLILSGHGVSLRVRRGALVIRDGFTHYPQVPQETILFPGDWRLPPRIVLLDTNGSVSFDVIEWLADRDIPLVILNWQGKVITALGGDSNSIDPTVRHAQLQALNNDTGLRLAVELIRRKIEASKETTKQHAPAAVLDGSLEKLDACLSALNGTETNVIGVRLIEAQAALAYFGTWMGMPMKWKKLSRKPIPPGWAVVGQRESLLSGTNRNATHPVNAMLNYGYRVLESQVQIAAHRGGLDPTIGYLHACRPRRTALIYDLMEPFRPMVDRRVLEMIRNCTFSPDDFVITDTGVCRLHPELAKRIVKLSVEDDAIRDVVQFARSFIAHKEPTGITIEGFA